MSYVRSNRTATIVAVVAIGTALIWAFWPAFTGMFRSWFSDPENAHGPLVLAFSLYLAWLARDRCLVADLRPAPRGLVALMVLGAARIGTGLIHSTAIDQLLLIPTVWAAVWTLFGWAAARAFAPAIGFAVFAVPLHGRLGFLFSEELQTVSTILSTVLLQLVGISAQREGNVIVLSDADLGVVEACSGLRMIMSFLAISVAFAIILKRPLWQKLTMVAAAAPVAIACNSIRIAATAVVHETAGKKWADIVFHDLAGWLMMPLALGFLWLEILVTDRLVVKKDDGYKPFAPLSVPKQR